MSDTVELEIDAGDVRLGITIRVLGGGSVAVRQGAQGGQHGGGSGRPPYQSRPQSSGASRPQGTRSTTGGAGRARYGESLIDPLNAARDRFGLADGRGAHAIAKVLGVARLSLEAVEEWLDDHPNDDLEALMQLATERGSGGRR